MFQSYALYPPDGGREHGLLLLFNGTPKAEIATKVNRVAGDPATGPPADRKPAELSGPASAGLPSVVP